MKKFGLKHHDLETMMENVAFMLRMLTLNIDRRHTKRTPLVLYILTLASLACYIYVYQVSTFWFIFWRNGSETLLEKIIVFSLGLNSLLGVSKFGYMYFKRDGLQKVVSAYLVCDATVLPHSRMSRRIDATLKTVKKRAAVFWVVIMANAVVYILIPLVSPGRRMVDDNQILWGLEPMVESPNYEIVYMLILLCVPVVAFGPVNLTSFLIIIVGYTEAQMTALSQELLNLWEDAQIDYKALELSHIALAVNQRVILNRYVKRRLENIIRVHAVNKQLINQVEGIYRNATAIEFAFVSTSLITALLGGLENTYLQIPFAMVQVVMDCVIGQRLIDANSRFEAAVYQCGWEDFDVSNMKLVMMMLQSAQKTMKLSAGGVNSLSYSTLMLMVKSIYSAYAALHSTMKERQK